MSGRRPDCHGYERRAKQYALRSSSYADPLLAKWSSTSATDVFVLASVTEPLSTVPQVLTPDTGRRYLHKDNQRNHRRT